MNPIMQYLPDLYRYAVEVRHDAYFSGDLGRRFIDLLSALNFDLVIYDTRHCVQPLQLIRL